MITLVTASSFTTTVRAFAFNEAVGQEPEVMLAIQHLCVLAEDVAVRVDFHQCFPDEFLVHWALGSRVVVVGRTPPVKKFRDAGVISVG